MMQGRFLFFSLFLFFFLTSYISAFSSINLSTLCQPSSVTLTIYQEGDLSLVQECYWIDLKQGLNTLYFDWSETMIDVTSIRLAPLLHPDKVKLEEVILSSKQEKNIFWKFKALEPLKELVEISYFTRGLSWETFYSLDINREKDEVSQLQGWVNVKNESGRDFLNARVRLITGEPHLLKEEEKKELLKAAARMKEAELQEVAAPPIRKEAVSEYYLYQIEGERDLKAGETSKISLFTTYNLPFQLIFQFNFTRWGEFPAIIYRFKNNQSFPLPPGFLQGWLAEGGERKDFLGENQISFTPSGEEIEVHLGWEKDLKLERKTTAFNRTDLKFSSRDDLVQYLQEEEYTLFIKNFLNKMASIRVREQIGGEWKLVTSSIPVDKKEANALQFKLNVPEKGEIKLTYRIQKIIRLR